jgi:hypothetical protein
MEPGASGSLPPPVAFPRQNSKHSISPESQQGQYGGALTIIVVFVVHRYMVAPGVGSTVYPFVIELSFPI